MPAFNHTNCSAIELKKLYTLSFRVLSSFILLFILLLSERAVAQTTGPGFPICTKPGGQTFLPKCTSNDLQVVGAFLTADQCSCSAGDTVTATLNMILFNKTGSTRTTFSFYANLFQYNTQTGKIDTSYITGCTGPVSPTSYDTAAFPSQYKFVCGDSLVLTNVWLAWSDASDRKTCETVTFCGIAPKCGNSGNITIRPLLTALTSTDSTCQNTSQGCITVDPAGGTAPYRISIGGTNFRSISGESVTRCGLAAGVYTITVRDTLNCLYTTSDTVFSKQCCVAPAKPIITATSAGICSNGTVCLTICNAVVGDSYYFVRGSLRDTAVATTSTVQFCNITPSTTNFSVFGKDVKGGTTCYSDTAHCADLVASCPTAGITQTERIQQPVEEVQTVSKVLVAPNPFSDRLKFIIQPTLSGQGSLELYNMLGQKVKVLYQGYIERGRTQNIDYSVPYAQRSNLIYLFTVGNQKISGKLLGLRN